MWSIRSVIIGRLVIRANSPDHRSPAQHAAPSKKPQVLAAMRLQVPLPRCEAPRQSATRGQSIMRTHIREGWGQALEYSVFAESLVRQWVQDWVLERSS